MERIVGAEVDLVDNADWLGQLRLTDFLRDVGGHFRVNDMMAKDSVRARLERDQGISYKEFSLHAAAGLRLPGTCASTGAAGCRWAAATSGATSPPASTSSAARAGARPTGLTFPLVTRADGSKFGKSEGGNLWLDPARTSPYEFFQFWLRVGDADVGRYLRLFTWLDRERIEALEAAVAEHPERREAQRVLAREVTAAVHGAAAAVAAEQAGQALFGGELGGLDGPTLLEVFAEAPATSRPRAELEGEGGLGLVELLVDTGLVASKSAARTAIEQGGVYVNNRREADVDRRLGPSDLLVGSYLVLRRGKRSYHLVRLV